MSRTVVVTTNSRKLGAHLHTHLHSMLTVLASSWPTDYDTATFFEKAVCKFPYQVVRQRLIAGSWT